MKKRITYGKGGKMFWLGNTPVSEDEFDAGRIDPEREHARMHDVCQGPMVCPSSTYPKASIAVGCHPDEIPQQMEKDRRELGIATRYNKRGQLIWEDRGMKKAYMHRSGLQDWDAYDRC